MSKKRQPLPAALDKIEWPQKVNQYREKCKEQCSCLRTENSPGQEALFRLLALSKQNNNISVMQYLVDKFLQDSIPELLKRKENGMPDYKCEEWVPTSKLCKKLIENVHNSKLKKDTDLNTEIAAGLQLFFTRFCSNMTFSLALDTKMDDSLKVFVEYIAAGVHLVENMMAKQGRNQLPPFQIDMVIIAKGVKGKNQNDNDDNKKDKNDKNDDYDDDEDEDDDQKEPKESPAIPENIKAYLTKEQMKFAECLKQKTVSKNTPQSMYRTLLEKFDKFHGNHPQKKYQYHRKRIIIVADRRLNNQNFDGDNNDHLFIYEPKKLHEYPKNSIPEWNFEASNATGAIFPNGLSANSAGDGILFVVSYVVEEKDKIRIYIYHRSKMMRFLPKDIKMVLPEFFVKTEENDAFINSNEIDDYAKSISKAKDPSFENLFQ